MSWNLADRARKNYLTPQIWKKTLLREIFIALWFFQQSCMICVGHHVGRHTLALQTSFYLYLVKRLIGYAQMCCKRYHTIFSTFFLKFKCKICVQKEVIHNLKKKTVVWSRDRPRTKSLSVCLKCDQIIIFIETMSHDLSVQMVYLANAPCF